jgi:prepilin-type N-terminal cleavage/methylation domain-containing protein
MIIFSRLSSRIEFSVSRSVRSAAPEKGSRQDDEKSMQLVANGRTGARPNSMAHSKGHMKILTQSMSGSHKDHARIGNRGFSLVEVLIVLIIVIVIAAMAIPKLLSMVRELRTAGDARDLNGAIVLAKMRAASNFARARVYFDLSTNTFHVDYRRATDSGWTTEGGTQYLSTGVTFGYGSLTSPPTGVAALTQAPVCLQDDMVSTNSNTACIMFNSRGIPILNSSWTPTPNDAIYVTDGRTVTGVTVSATGMTKIWRTGASSANWTQR